MADDRDALTAEEAAAYLGVSRSTLYAYVSRGLLSSAPGPGPSRARRYPRTALDALRDGRERRRQRDLAAHGALHWGLPVLDSELTLIADGRLYYRGHDALALAAGRRFEDVAALLWTGSADAGGLFAAGAPGGRGGGDGDVADRLAAHLLHAAGRTLPTLGAAEDVRVRGAARTVEGLFTAAGARGRGPLAARLARGWGCRRVADIDAALVLCADHELDVSSFTARVVASADARLEHVLLAALCALRGRRHGGNLERVAALVEDAGRDGAARAAGRALGEHGVLPGFGHPLYPAGDPRAAELLRRAAPDPAGPAGGLLRLAADELGAHPTLDFALVVFAAQLGLPGGGAFALFALGRSAGWVAHALEAARDGRLIRPRSRYTGPAPEAST